MKPAKIREDAITAGALAGLCGGVAEIAWVSAYSVAGGTSAVAVAREVIASIAPAAAGLYAAPLLGIALHLLLSEHWSRSSCLA